MRNIGSFEEWINHISYNIAKDIAVIPEVINHKRDENGKEKEELINYNTKEMFKKRTENINNKITKNVVTIANKKESFLRKIINKIKAF